MVPKCFQYKIITPALTTSVDKGRKNADANGLGARPTISSQSNSALILDEKSPDNSQIDSKLKETLE